MNIRRITSWLFCFGSMAILVAPSCAPMSNENATGAGAAAGALGGAALGAIAGNQTGRAGEGALVGALGGGLLGVQQGKNWFGGDGSIQRTRREGGVQQ